MFDKEDIVGWSDLLGTPVYSDILFSKGSYINSQGKTIEYDELRLYDVLMIVSMKKNIVMTPVQGKIGSFKEYISDGDFEVSISGRLTQKDMYKYPRDLMNKLINICKVQDSISVVSRFLQRFSIYNIVIESYDLPQTEGSHTIQEFQLRCISDEPVELILR